MLRSFWTILILYVVDINAFVWYKLDYNKVVLNIIYLYVLWGTSSFEDGNFYNLLIMHVLHVCLHILLRDKSQTTGTLHAEVRFKSYNVYK